MIFKKNRFKNVFVWLVLLFIGFVFIFSVPIFQKPDEGYHYTQILSFVGGVRNFPNFNLPSKIYKTEYELSGTSFSGMIMGSFDNKFPISLYKGGFLLSKNNEVIDTNLNFNFNSLFSYFPQILGYSLNFGFPVLGFYMARIFALLFFLICIYWSNKIIDKKYRSILLIYCCLPMVWQQVTAISYDVVFLSLCPLIFSLLTKYFSEKKLKIKDLILFSFLLILVSLVKLGNQLFLFLIIFFPFEKLFVNFSKWKNFSIRIVLFLISGLCLFWKTSSVGIISADININQLIQKNILFSNPVYILNIALNTLKYQFDFYFKTFFGGFGWLDYYLDERVYILMVIFLISVFVLMLGKIKESILNYKQIIGLLIFVFSYMGIIFGSMYLVWTPAAAKVIQGVQGRYFLPVFPFFLFALSELILKIGKEKSKKILFGITVSIIFISFVSATYKRYYNYSKLYQNPVELEDNFNLVNKTPKKIEEVLLDKEIDIEIKLKEKKFSAFQIITKLPKEKIVIPYAYSIMDGNNKIIQKGYLPVNDMVNNGIYQEDFKIKEINSDMVRIKIWPLVINEKESYISLLKNTDDDSYFVNLLYIRK